MPPPTHAAVPVENFTDPARYEQPLLDFLAANGSPLEFKEKLDSIVDGSGDREFAVFEEDVTGDTTPEFLASITVWNSTAIFIFGCRGGEYAVLHRIQFETPDSSCSWPSRLEAVLDLNGDGIKEVVYSILFNVGNEHTNLTAQVFEWNGQEFRELVQDYPSPSLDWGRRTVDAYVDFKDVDTNRTIV